MTVWQRVSSRFRRRPGGPHRRSRVQSTALDAFADQLGRSYLALTALFALLGYLYLWAFPVLAVVFLWSAVAHASAAEWLALALDGSACLAFAGISLLIARMRPRPPELQALSSSSTPKLFRLIESVRSECRAPRLSAVMMNHELDVKLVRTPRRGFPVLFTYQLIVGLPALQLLSPLHFKGLVVRRLAQAAGREHRFLRWLAMWRDVGPLLLATCSDWRRPEHVVLRLFLLGYAPLYRWWSVPAARLYELQLDKRMMDSINDRDVAELLAAQLIARRYLKERYFPELLELARKRPHPPPVAFSGLDRRFANYWSSADAKQWLKQAFASVARPGDTCPALARRLLEIGHHTARLPSPLRQAASRVLLQGALKHTLARQDGLWMRRVLPQWRSAHQAAKREQQRLRALYEKSRKARLDLSEARELASLVERCYGKNKAIPFYRQLMANNPGDANVSFAAGRFLLSVHDDQGVQALKRAMRLDPRFVDPATNLIENYQAAKRTVPTDTGSFQATPTGGQIIVTEVRRLSELN